MNQPSNKALQLGEELFDYVAYGLMRPTAIRELASIVDDHYSELLEAVGLLLRYAELHGGATSPLHVAHLQQVFWEYQPKHTPPDSQSEIIGLGNLTQPRLF